jgi:hypothetical protein
MLTNNRFDAPTMRAIEQNVKIIENLKSKTKMPFPRLFLFPKDT